ncbi:MAG: signal recognition particle-docking protein FtsY [Chitinivibrionales bacterium]|nr:signal recognition particle-docking protein FtsY [Chitinivibrionales bacterium]
MNFFSKLKSGLHKTRTQITSIIGRPELDETFFDSMEEALIAADIGLELALDILDVLREDIKLEKVNTAAQAYVCMKEIIVRLLSVNKTPDEFPPKPWVILVAGVNGVGKTTTIGKMCHELRNEDKKVMLGAADTFRAGAVDQLRIWAERTGADFVSQHAGADAASVAYDAMEAAASRDTDVLMLDTAGRLHNKVNLMNELQKMVRVIRRHTSHAPNEILLVIDATTGQNALQQAKAFNDILGVTGLVITKLDGTAKGGIALALTRKFGIPIRKIGVGEGVEDLRDFDATEYVEAMFGELDSAR